VSTKVRRSKPISELAQAAAGPLLIGGLTLAALDVARRVFRSSQLFCPTRDPLISWNPEAYGIARDRVDEVWFETEDGEMLHGWYCRAERPVASALYCHGNTGNLTNTAHVMPHLMASGISVLTFDYRGFGRSTGRPSLSGIVSDGLCAARFHETLRPADVPSLLYGFSLGGAVGAQVVQHHSFDGMVLQSTFTNLPDIARVTFPRLPLHLVAGDFFDTLAAVRKLKLPLLVIHGADDEVCPLWMAEKLHDAAGHPARRIHVMAGGLHKDLYVREPDALIRSINGFAGALPRNTEVFDDPSPLFDRWIDGLFRYMRRSLRRAFVHHPV
jgi:alpha-beta hydrolase superfamily lysophospholipase